MLRMAGSLNHIVAPDGRFTMDSIENLGDAHEALDECFKIIRHLTGGSMGLVNNALQNCDLHSICADLKPGGPDAL